MIARLAACFALAASLLPAWGMTPEEAYAAIPHKRTLFDPASSGATGQSASLARLFAMSDRGVVLRVEGMRAHSAGDARALGRVLADYDALIELLKGERFDASIAPARDLIVAAMQGQRRYLASRPAGTVSLERADLSRTAEVREASRNLHRAYDLLKKQFPRETARNVSAYYDHLCALDYL